MNLQALEIGTRTIFFLFAASFFSTRIQRGKEATAWPFHFRTIELTHEDKR